jgi:radical SAM superfamily enzyme YgiQ (UPF0313 family)
MFCERVADAEWDGFLATKDEPSPLQEETEFSLNDLDFRPGDKQRGVPGAKQRKDGHIQTGRVCAKGQNISIVAVESHVRAGEAEFFTLELVFSTKFARQIEPAAEGANQKCDEAPEHRKAQDEYRRVALKPIRVRYGQLAQLQLLRAASRMAGIIAEDFGFLRQRAIISLRIPDCGRRDAFTMRSMNIVLISTYELGRQPFGLASPAAWLREQGLRVTCLDLSRESLRESVVRAADLIAFYVPMHTATRLAVALLPVVRELNPRAHLCLYGLYAPVNEKYLRRLGVGTILGGEFEEGLASLATRLSANRAAGAQAEPVVSLARQKFRVPDRRELVPLEKYARLVMPSGEALAVGYTEASRGCKHLCRHCPIVPVYQGNFRIVDREIVLADVRQQVAAGAQHISFGDPDFFNGVGHAILLVEALHREFPALTYDVVIKVEHLLKHQDCLGKLRETGCLFVTSAVESVDDAVLDKLDKHHTRADFLRAVELFREARLVLQPTFVPFTPWTTAASYCELLDVIRDHRLIENVAPIQLAIRLLIPAGSRLLKLDDVRETVGPFDEAALVYPWNNPDARVDRLCEELQQIVHAGENRKRSRAQIFQQIEEAALVGTRISDGVRKTALPILPAQAAIPYLNEPWYC